jgi:hypothetical protein
MNRWGRMAREHWQQHRPSQYAQIPDLEAFFGRLGDHISAEMSALALATAGDDRPGEGFLGKVRRLGTARITAQEQILREILPPSEADDADAADDADGQRRTGPWWEPGQS